MAEHPLDPIFNPRAIALVGVPSTPSSWGGGFHQAILDMGFDNVKWNSTTIIPDVDCPDDAGGDDKAFFLNSDYLLLEYSPSLNFKMGDMIEGAEQFAFSGHLYWAGELTCTHCAVQGIHLGITGLV